MTLLQRSVHDAAVTAIAAGTYGTTYAHRAFPTVCYHGPVGDAAEADSTGVARIIYRRGQGHASYDGSVCSVTKVDGGSWSAEQVIIDGTQVGGSSPTNAPNSPLPDGLKPDVRDVHCWKAASGRILISFCQHATGSYATGLGHTWKTWFLYSDDNGDTWSTPVEVTFTGAGAPSLPQGVYGVWPMECLSGNILVSGYGLVGGVWREMVARSTDGGTTWAYRGTIDDPAGSGYGYILESCLQQFPSGRIITTMHGDDSVPTDIYYYESDDEGATWSARSLLMAAAASNRNDLLITTDGDVILSAGFAATSYANGIKQSFDDAATFSGSYVTLSTNPHGSGGPLFAAGCMIGPPATTPNVGYATAYESNDQNLASIQWTTLTRGADVPPASPALGYGNTVSGGYGAATAFSASAASLTITPNAEWTQAGPLITVATEGLSTVQASVSTPAAGSVFFDGADEGLFSASLDGLAWAGVVPVGAGNTPITLRINPSAAGTFTARVGVAV